MALYPYRGNLFTVSVFFTNVWTILQFTAGIFFKTMSLLFTTAYLSDVYDPVREPGIEGAYITLMKSSAKLLFTLAAATAFFLVQPVKADGNAHPGSTLTVHPGSTVSVPDGGSTISLVCFALLGLGALRSRLGR